MSIRPKRLFASFDSLAPSDFLNGALLLGILFGGGAVWMAISAAHLLHRLAPLAVGLLGAIVGTVVAGAAILGAFLDQAFLKKLKRIGSRPTPYFAPFLFTAFVGTIAGILLVIVAALPDSTPAWLVATAAGLAGLTSGWAMGSIIYALDALAGFIELREVAVDVRDDPAEGPTPLQGFRS